MSGSPENAASGAYETSNRRGPLLNLTTARRMLPLVRHISQEILQTRRVLAQLHPEQAHLDRQKRHLAWPERSRRYQLRDEIAACEEKLQQAQAELEGLGVALVNPEAGWVGFPTLVNGRQAFFSWKPGEEDLRYWHFADEQVRRLIPSSWIRVDDISLARNG